MNFPIKIPQTKATALSGGVEHRLSYEDLAKEIKRKYDIDEESVLRQVNVNEDSVGFVFEEVL